jgi:hypothetical protein
VVFLPSLNFISAFGIEAHLTQTLNQAQDIIDRLHKMAAINARATYMTMAWGNRIGAPSAMDKQAILDDVDHELVDLKVTPQERSEITRPYVQLISVDFYGLFVQTFDRYAYWKLNQDTNRFHADASEDNRRALQILSDQISAWRSVAFGDYTYSKIQGARLGDELTRATPTWLDANEMKQAQIFRSQLATLFEGCQDKGGYTPEAAEFYDKYHDIGGEDLKIKELFGINPSDVK